MKTWRYTGQGRPEFAETPGPGQESVWDYPRPPQIVADHRSIRVQVAGETVAETVRALRVLETGSPPTFYLPALDVDHGNFVASPTQTYCEWKGTASYFSFKMREVLIENLGWYYKAPKPAFASIKDHYAFYPGRAQCYIDDELVVAQTGGFYGGWISKEIVGPFKGEPGTQWW